MSTFTDAFLINRRLAKRLQTDQLWVVVKLDTESRELFSLDYQNAFAEPERSIYRPVSEPHVKGVLELFLSKFDRAVLQKTEATTMDQLLYDTREFLDILRNAEGRVFL
ncbi:hypothetical protein ACQE3D_10760 [Methylomonas sp. MS20]|uniref:hypothetical protein n=1 Tax=unclassified Methylomonas TaxID=2608980 RepID=UPI0028A436BB|nr:hypothetical protein [Methylomonas sp. MV1]MDT4328522.1 hypothetical protein [Methylomonas sp. MV1]